MTSHIFGWNNILSICDTNLGTPCIKVAFPNGAHKVHYVYKNKYTDGITDLTVLESTPKTASVGLYGMVLVRYFSLKTMSRWSFRNPFHVLHKPFTISNDRWPKTRKRLNVSNLFY